MFTSSVPSAIALGLIVGVAPGGGMHGGLNRHEMVTTLIVKAPVGRRGVDTTPFGLVDIALTIAWLPGVDTPSADISLLNLEDVARAVNAEVCRALRGGHPQALHRSVLDGRTYLDCGGLD